MPTLCPLQLSDQMRNGISSRASCWACNALAGLFLSPVYSKEMMTMAVNTVCTSFRLQSPRVCSGIVDSFKVSRPSHFLLAILSSLVANYRAPASIMATLAPFCSSHQ